MLHVDCLCKPYSEMDVQPLYYRRMTHRQIAPGYNHQGQRVKYKWERIGAVCLNCNTVKFTRQKGRAAAPKGV